MKGLKERTTEQVVLSYIQTMFAQQIKLLATNELGIKWDDGHESKISLQKLRDGCPCASCRGETILLKKYEPVKKPDLPGKYSLAGIQQIGHYAIQLSWKDGHSTGIYTWEQLRDMCECGECLAKR